jgi:hypothetical protein
MATAHKKRKKSSNRRKSSSGGGGVMMSMRSGFRNVARKAVGSGKKQTKPPSTLSKVLNWGLTAILLAIAAYLLARRLGYI